MGVMENLEANRAVPMSEIQPDGATIDFALSFGIAIDDLAEASQIRLSPDEKERFGRELSAMVAELRILDEIVELDAADDIDVAATRTKLRPDEPSLGLESEAALGQAPLRAKNEFRVPKVVE